MGPKAETFLYKSAIGNIFCTFEGDFLVDVSVGENESGNHVSEKTSKTATLFFKELDDYFKSDLRKFKQKIKFLIGTPFERQIWLALKNIPCGEVRTYKWIAEQAGSAAAVRAAGQALKKNPLPIILPCHRIVASNGGIGGFSCGVEKKIWLLRHEGVLCGLRLR
ncbi:MAG: methylated-DNA--[protein]-cysteine S-methyltransferase [Nitrospirae bacterium]|nr:MAG: methylated-DNA--[protein]-cysteine S-methyltransferase [Nitrospirota bacterium]